MKPYCLISVFLLFPLLSLFGTNIDANVNSSQTWTVAGSPYIITGNRIILGGAIVTVDAGVEIRFNAATSLTVGSSSAGGLIVNGTAESPVLFTANSGTPTPGFWNYLRTAGSSAGNVSCSHAIFEYGGSSTGLVDVNGGNPQFADCTFRHSQNYGLYHTSSTASASIQNCAFQNNGSYPLYWNSNQVQNILAGNSFSGNNPDRILLRSITISTGNTWQNPGIPLEPENDLTVRSNGANPLVLSPGIQVLFRSGKAMIVGYTTPTADASISANGVTFGAVNPGSGWNGVEFLAAIQPSSLTSCTISDVSVTPLGAIYAHNNQALTISGCLFTNNDSFGLYCGNGANFTVSGSTFTANAGTVSLAAMDMEGLLEDNQYTGNTDDRIVCRGGTLNESATWTTQPVPILVTTNITGYSSTPPTIIIPYGTILEFAAGISFFLGYTASSSYGAVLQATGVTFRGAQSTAGYWTGLIFNRFGGPHLLSGCTIRDAGYSSNPGIQLSCINTTITGCSILNCAAVGINFSDISLSSLSGSIISGCGSYPLSLPANSVRVLGEGNNFSGNAIDMVEVRAQTIDVSGSWRDPGVPYYINNDLNIYATAPFPHLQILPGTVIALPTSVCINIGYSASSTYKGSLSAEGVTFTRSSPTADPDGLNFNNFTVEELCVFEDCVFEYQEHSSLYSAVYVTGCSPTFNGCTFRNNPGFGISTSSTGRPAANNCSFLNNGDYPIKTYATAFDVVSGTGNYFSGNTPDRILIAGGTLAQNYIWNNPGAPVEVSSDITIFSDSFPILKINSGLELLFRSNTSMIVGYAAGTTYGGGLQADGATFSALSGVPGGWSGLRFLSSLAGTSYLRNCVVEYAGSEGNISLANSPLATIESCITRYGTYGILLTGASSNPLIIRNYILNNEYGVSASGSANPLVGCSTADANCIEGNLNYGVYNGSTSILLNAEYNWWGDASGPTHSGNPAGTGDDASNYVDYDPWRDSNIGDAPARFHLLSPANASVWDELSLALDWEEAIDPSPGDTVTYTLLIATNSSFSSGLITIPDLTSTVYHVGTGMLEDDTRYYWKVSATDTQSQTTWSYESYWYFDIAIPEAPLPVVLSDPLNNGTVFLTSNLLAWQPTVDPDPGDLISYTVYQDISAGFENAQTFSSPNPWHYSGFCAPGSLVYWKVMATDLTGRQSFSPVWRFFVSPDAVPRAPSLFTLSMQGNDLQISWDAVPGADSYDVYFSLDPTAGYSLLQNVVVPSCLHLGAASGPRGFYRVVTLDSY